MSIFPLVLSVFLSFSAPSCKDSYIIEIPNNIDLIESNNFTVKLKNNNLKDNQTLNVSFDDNFVLSDEHGKNDIYGTVNNTDISFTSSDSQSKNIYYSIEDIPVGKWNGHLSMTIDLNEQTPTNTLLSGPEINEILMDVYPNNITFSHDEIDGDYLYDLSLAQDESILLYSLDDFNEEVVITNKTDLPIIANEDMSYMFCGVDSIFNIVNIDYLDTSNTKNMSHLFTDILDLECISGIENIDTSSCIDMSSMFENCITIEELELSNWNTSNCEDMNHMFAGSGILDLYGLENFDTSKVKDMSFMFADATSISFPDITDWNVENVINMDSMFKTCKSFFNIDLSGWNPKSCENFSNMFYLCSSLKSIGNVTGWNTQSLTNMYRMFSNCKKLQSLDLSGFNVSNVTNMASTFEGCQQLPNIGDVSNWDVSNVTTFNKTFYQTSIFTGFDSIENWNVSSNCIDLSYMFYNNDTKFPSSLNLSKWHTDSVENTSYMFYNCFPLTYLDITGWNTGSLVNAQSMFEGNNKNYQNHLATITGISDIDTSNLSNMSRMFYNCYQLNADLSLWDTSSVATLNSTFYGNWHFDFTSLEDWNIPNTVDIANCFANNAGVYSTKYTPSWAKDN